MIETGHECLHRLGEEFEVRTIRPTNALMLTDLAVHKQKINVPGNRTGNRRRQSDKEASSQTDDAHAGARPLARILAEHTL